MLNFQGLAINGRPAFLSGKSFCMYPLPGSRVVHYTLNSQTPIIVSFSCFIIKDRITKKLCMHLVHSKELFETFYSKSMFIQCSRLSECNYSKWSVQSIVPFRPLAIILSSFFFVQQKVNSINCILR